MFSIILRYELLLKRWKRKTALSNRDDNSTIKKIWIWIRLVDNRFQILTISSYIEWTIRDVGVAQIPEYFDISQAPTFWIQKINHNSSASVLANVTSGAKADLTLMYSCPKTFFYLFSESFINLLFFFLLFSFHFLYFSKWQLIVSLL